MNIIIDKNISQAKEAFSDLGNVKLLDGRNLKNDDIKETDILIVRSITKVNKKLLNKSRVKFVGTATIGTDHIDLEYLKKQNIQFADAKGCNADSVTEYVFTSLLKVTSEKKSSLQGKTIGVVGVGNIGSRIVRVAESLGMEVLKNDPPLERKGVGSNYATLEDTIKADVLTIHVPMTHEGIDKTFHLLNENNFKLIRDDAIIINSSRGAVVDNSALLSASSNRRFDIVLDVWENEPSINTELLSKTKVATPHIAGYSYEGKVNGTKMIYNALCKFLNKQSTWQPELPEIESNKINLSENKTDEENLYNLFSSIYKIENDDQLLRKIQQYELNERAKYFDTLRKKYPIRREFSNYIVEISKDKLHLKSFLENFRFKVEVN